MKPKVKYAIIDTTFAVLVAALTAYIVSTGLPIGFWVTFLVAFIIAFAGNMTYLLLRRWHKHKSIPEDLKEIERKVKEYNDGKN